VKVLSFTVFFIFGKLLFLGRVLKKTYFLISFRKSKKRERERERERERF
jgi:hypothetical protein